MLLNRILHVTLGGWVTLLSEEHSEFSLWCHVRSQVSRRLNVGSDFSTDSLMEAEGLQFPYHTVEQTRSRS